MKLRRQVGNYRGKWTSGQTLAIGFGVFLFMVFFVLRAQAADFNPACTAADLIAAISAANGNGEADVINLPAGCTITLTAIDNNTDGDNGLPDITTDITINGNGGAIQRDSSSAASFRIFHVAGTGVLTLNNLTIQNGSDPGSSEGAGIYNLGTLNINNAAITNNNNDYGGGGIYNIGPVVNIVNSNISNNTTNSGGGGIRHYGGTMTITDSTISGNESGTGGGGVNINNGTGVLNLIRCTVTNNRAQKGGGGISGNEADGGSITITASSITNNQAGLGGDGGGGGGISLNYSEADFVLIENTTISGNTADDSGGGISHNNSSTTVSLTINNCTISNNETDYSGGGIASATSGSAQLTISNSIFSGNHATRAGGGIHTDSLFLITASTFSGNIAGYNNEGSGGGGAINFIDSDASGDIINSTFAGNTAGLNGGGVRNAGTANFTNCTFSGNSAPNGEGGGIYDDGGVTNLQNTIVAGSPSGGNCSGTINDLGSNLCDDGSCGFGPGDNTNPMLDPSGLRDNGGPTFTIGLAAGSPAIDGVADCSGLSLDQRGMLRPVGAACDIGALEVQSENPATPIPTLSEWGMIFMSLLMAAAGFWMMRRRQIS